VPDAELSDLGQLLVIVARGSLADLVVVVVLVGEDGER
jgi:hypothetical protein